ncbi:3'-5' exonuclease [Candidatus Peribacteria bacterium]|nr:3'-5' exonuclease [Candidatus Peribacteria bacterium]
MKLPSLPLVVLDTETTGFVPRVHRVIEFASAEVRDGKVATEYEQLFHHAGVPPTVEVLTRIRTADLKGKPAFADELKTVLKHLPDDALLVGQNIPFDIGMLKGEGLDLSERPYIDTSMLSSLVFPELQSYSLGYLSTVLDLNHNPPHRALGDVRATTELLGKCWERLMELPKDLRDLADAIMARAPKGYRMLFEALPAPTAKKEPKWLSLSKAREKSSAVSSHLTIPAPSPSPGLIDEPLDPLHLQSVIEGALKDTSTRHWIAVKGLRPVLQRLPDALLKNIRVLYPPHSLIDVDAVQRFAKQEAYTADEATLALKLAWYEPSRRDEFPMHGSEEAVWNGKLSCTAASKAYLDQFKELPNVVLLDHRELLEFLQEPEHPGAKSMGIAAGSHPERSEGRPAAHVIIDDASMLEDTATKAFGWFCAIDDVRAAAQGNPLMTKFVDTLQLWIEKVRQFQDIRYLAHSDLSSQDTKGLRTILDEVLTSQKWPEQLLQHLGDLQRILQVENLPHRIAWIEQKPNGGQLLQSVPERIGLLLGENLFKRFPTTLLIPQGAAEMLPEILPPKAHMGVRAGESTGEPVARPYDHAMIHISFDAQPNLDEILKNPPPGKTVILLPGKGAIEEQYVKYTEALEAKGVTLICQGLNGGMGRMQAEFLAAKAPALWLVTPWMFEGTDLPEGTVDHLVLKSLPFDHPNHPILGRRSLYYANAFSDYSLPRTLHRLFRLLRAYARIKTKDGDARVLDDRIQTKGYGKTVRGYLEQFSDIAAAVPGRGNDANEAKDAKELKTEVKAKTPKKKSVAKDQLSMF